jgi:uncharacterized membrane protein YfcA
VAQYRGRVRSRDLGEAVMDLALLITLGAAAGAGAGLLAGLLGIGGGVVVVPVVFYGLVVAHMPYDQAAHVAVATSLAAILPAALVSSFVHWREGDADLEFLRDWGPGIAIGVVAAQIAAPHIRGTVMTSCFGLLCVVFAARYAFPARIQSIRGTAPGGTVCQLAGAGIGLCSGLAGVGGGILTNIAMSLTGVTMHRSIGRAAAVGVVVSVPATIVAALGPGPHGATDLGSIDVAIWACIAPTQAVTAWFGARLARHLSAGNLSRVMGAALLVTGAAMLRSAALAH